MATKKEIIRKLFRKWGHIATHWGWHFDVSYHAGLDDMPGNCTPEHTFITFSQFQYLQASIHCNLFACADQDDDALESMVVHELTHLLLDPLGKSDNLEYTCTVISRTILGVTK